MNRLELRALYHSKLHPRILDLESMRYRVLIYSGLAIGCFVAFGVEDLWMRLVKLESKLVPAVVACGLIAAIGFFAFKAFTTRSRYRRLFKIGVIKELVKIVDSTFAYDPSDGITENTYTRSKLFLKSPDKYDTDDYIQGQIGSAKFEMAEVHSQYLKRTNKRDSYRTIFHGLFFHGSFPKTIKGDTFVLPDQAQKLFGSVLGHLFQGHNPSREDLIKMESPEFEKYFVVYGTDQIEARYILTPKMMERVLDFKKRVGRPLYLAFRGQDVFLAVPTGPLFEPAVFTKAATFRDMVKMVETISIAAEIVTQLELSQELWQQVG